MKAEPIYLTATASQWASLQKLYAVHRPATGAPFIILNFQVRVTPAS